MYRPLRGVAMSVATTMCGAAALSAAACSTPTPAVGTPTATPTVSASPTQPAPTSTATAATTPAPAAAVASYRDATYVVEGKPVALKNGLLEVEAAPGSASKITTRVFGNDATGDVNGDGQADVAFVLTQSPGGSGTFFYAVAALKTETGYTGTNAVLLGDRIAPQTTRIVDGLIEVNYAERKPGEPMTTQPSVGVTKRLRVTDGKLLEVR
jgi:hypothetical protein